MVYLIIKYMNKSVVKPQKKMYPTSVPQDKYLSTGIATSRPFSQSEMSVIK